MAEVGSRLASLVHYPSFVAGHPSLAALLQAQDALAQYPMPGVNVHTQPDLSQAWLQEQTIEPVPFGSFADPVSQLAFLMAPGVLRGLKGTLEAAATPGPGLGGLLASERGGIRLPNPQPWPQETPLPAFEPYAQEGLTPLVRAGRGAGVLGHMGRQQFREFQGLAPELTEGLPYAQKLLTYKNAVDVFKQQKALSPDGLPSSKDLLELFDMGKGTGDWYTNARQTLWNVFGEDGDLMAQLIAATSPRQRVSRNVDLALEAYQRYKVGLDPVPPTAMPAHAENIHRAIRGEALSGPKVSRFAANILGDKDPVTVDIWMMRLFGLPYDKAPTPQQYRMVSEWTTQLAKDMGVSPSEMQAALWVGGKLAHGPIRGEVAANIPLPLGQIIEQRVSQMQPQLERLTGALGTYFDALTPEAKKQLMGTLAVASTIAPTMKDSNKSQAGVAGGKVWQSLGVESPNAHIQNYMQELLEDAPGFGE